MQGRFEGLSQARFEIFKPLLPPQRAAGRGRPYAVFRTVINSILRILITGSRWSDIPEGEQWSPKSTAHDRLGRRQADGTWENILSHIPGPAEAAGLIGRERASVDGSSVPGKGGGEEVDHGYKGKGVTLHIIVDGNGMPVAVTSTGAAGSERHQVEVLPDKVDVRTGRAGRAEKTAGSFTNRQRV